MLVREWFTVKRDGKEDATTIRVYEQNRGLQWLLLTSGLFEGRMSLHAVMVCKWTAWNRRG